MPETKLVIMSGLLLPGRSEYLEMTLEINRQLEVQELLPRRTHVPESAHTAGGSRMIQYPRC